MIPVLLGIVAVFAIGSGIFYFYNKPTGPTSYKNDALSGVYKVLSDEKIWRAKVVPSDNPQQWNVPEQNIVIKEVDKQFNFYCGDKKAKFEKYYSFTVGGYNVGGWDNIYIVDCENYYFIYEFGDDGSHLFGPFDLVKTTPVESSASDSPIPLIVSITPSSGPIGTVVELKGKNLAGFEGDLDAVLENSKGEIAFLPGIGQVPRADQTIRVKIESKLCKSNNSYSGLPCKDYLSIMPGKYFIYSLPWNKQSNKVQFTVTN